MCKTHVLSVPSAKAPFEKIVIERRHLRPNDVLIDIKFSGVCHSDIHSAYGEWANGIFPMVPGHEIAGVVTAIGSEVTKFSVGDRVGVGCFVDSCGECEYCLSGEEQYCTKGVINTYNQLDYDGNPTYGGYSQKIVVKEGFVVHIPTALNLDVAAPLLCAGITTYSPLKHWNAGPGKKVAIVGMGGLGHLAIQFAHALGADVTVLSRSMNKKDEALELGADQYFATNDPATFAELAGHFDLILNTVSANLPVDAYLSLLRVDGTLVNVGAPAELDKYHVFSLIMGRRSIAGSLVGGIRETQEMLDFAAEHGIEPKIEIIRAEQIEEAYERVLRSDVRYRFVMDISTL
ncbi:MULTISPECIES: NAD(P)-dependent alcohol dehydrogenase [Brevibacillus]|uniref:Putative formaldehyde dehydrogenase AdhA n=1 Tax=Brevibacillus parabrevis TaxID=54914 RepID=A0A4Y3PNG2_BREPA|nr:MULTISPECIES: NAD(P)-dependent alcohol dehydrogenase [Brevibacillus]MBU8710970.1 NAD(P)-dependent alcohol dehydrogenase [Brevibacillus parabrevis]RNB92794.1 NAD(P)-dependent alcohol dehydrogenase [Brevibacillus parabrevis]UED66632.1 NAD(P)-dependent alcohol dehydrogenase [Brevibacillus sp. HD3.3A]WDV92877.1 NAD(P)-dependent alcohol dehydrogenase [Brevibacillus parabrevis]GEB34867.1 putative formaldehyde dehydrogenase AdhA [Brevibacillus parabrevis]